MQFFFVIPGIIWIKENIVVAIAFFVTAASSIGLTGTAIYVLASGSSIPNALTVLKAIQTTSTLVTQKATYDISVHTGIIAGFQGANSYNGDYTGIGEIHAGIDLSDLTEEDIVFANNHFEIQLPAPKFTTCVISNFQLVNRSQTLFNADWNQLYQLATIDAYYSLTEQGVEGKLLDLAEAEAGTVVKNLVSHITDKDVLITFAIEGRGSGSDTRCEPTFPPNWGKEDLSYNWLRIH